jgi:hypothetical protein
MNKVSINNIYEIESLNNSIIAEYPSLINYGKNHTSCGDYHGDKCYLPANATLLHKYLKNKQALKQVDNLIDKNIITGNIDIRPDSTIRYQVKFNQFIRGGFDKYQDTVYHHELVYHISDKDIYEIGDYIVVKSKEVKPNWFYLITKQWID